jgi:hypothetical protein
MAALGMITSYYLTDLSPKYTDQFPLPFGIFMGVFYFLIGLIYFFPILFLYRFFKKINIAIQSKDQGALNIVLDHQNPLSKQIGIFTILVLAIYLLIFIFAAFGFL